MARELKKMTVKILKEGDQVINVWSDNSSYFIAVKQQSGEVCVYSVTLDEEKKPRLSRNSPLTVAFGEGEIESIFSTETGDVRAITG